MGYYGLIKETSRIKRNDTIEDLHRVTQWRYSKGLSYISPKSQSVRSLENAVALSLKDIDLNNLPELIRGKSFYISILPEILLPNKPKNKL